MKRLISKLARFFNSRVRKTVTIPKVPYRPLAILDVSTAPLVHLRNNKGDVISSCDITKDSFKESLDGWSSMYSIIYPNSDAWTVFWTAYKHML